MDYHRTASHRREGLFIVLFLLIADRWKQQQIRISTTRLQQESRGHHPCQSQRTGPAQSRIQQKWPYSRHAITTHDQCHAKQVGIESPNNEPTD